jgi:hypothetical protein
MLEKNVARKITNALFKKQTHRVGAQKVNPGWKGLLE